MFSRVDLGIYYTFTLINLKDYLKWCWVLGQSETIMLISDEVTSHELTKSKTRPIVRVAFDRYVRDISPDAGLWAHNYRAMGVCQH